MKNHGAMTIDREIRREVWDPGAVMGFIGMAIICGLCFALAGRPYAKAYSFLMFEVIWALACFGLFMVTRYVRMTLLVHQRHIHALEQRLAAVALQR